MVEGFIYFLQLLISQYENAFKIGCSGDFHTRMPSYGGHLGPYEYQSNIIEITRIPIQIRLRYHGNDKISSLCEHAEAYLHDCYSDIRVRNPTSHQVTEFFSPQNRVTIDNIMKILDEANIEYEYVGLYDKDNHLNDLHKNLAKKEKESKPKINKEFNQEEKEEIKILIDKWKKEPLNFIKQMILKYGSELRSIQSELWEKLNENPEEINGIIKWPTGAGKRIAIIMIVIVLYLYYKSIGKPFRCVIAANRNDIFEGNASAEYELIKHLGIKVYQGSNGNLSKIMKDLKEEKSFLLFTTQQSLVSEDNSSDCMKVNKLNKLKIDCLIYDETQNITSPKMYEYLIGNKPKHLIGISATPYTDDEKHNKKLKQIYNDKIISECTYEEAISNKWINDCKYHIYSCKDEYPSDKITTIINKKIEERIRLGMWKTKKFIIWIPETNTKKEEYFNYFNENTDWDIKDNINNKEFKSSNVGDKPLCLVLCQKGREGYDEKGIEFGVSIGNSQGHIYVQQQGRSQRVDYEGQLSEFLIFTVKDITELSENIEKYMDIECIGDFGQIDELIEDKQKIKEITEEDKQIELEIEIKRLELEKLESELEKRNSEKKELEGKKKEEQNKQRRVKYKNDSISNISDKSIRFSETKKVIDGKKKNEKKSFREDYESIFGEESYNNMEEYIKSSSDKDWLELYSVDRDQYKPWSEFKEKYNNILMEEYKDLNHEDLKIPILEDLEDFYFTVGYNQDYWGNIDNPDF